MGLLRRPGHLLCRQHEGRGPHLSADLHRYLRQGGLRQALRPQDANHRGGDSERSGAAVLRGARHCAVPGAEDRGTEYCGNPEHHDYELYLAVEDIDHTRTKTKSPQTNGICERFHRTVLDEFYRVAFRKKIYRTIDGLQTDLEVWVKEYNETRPHQGRWCYGKTPMQTFLDALPIAREKLLRPRNTGHKSSADTHHDEEPVVRTSAYFYRRANRSERICRAGKLTSGSRTRHGRSPTSMVGSVTASGRCNSNTGSAAGLSIASSSPTGCLPKQQTGCRQQPALVAQLGDGAQHGAGERSLQTAGSSQTCQLTSTHRTARCGPACRVVWQGTRRYHLRAPMPIRAPQRETFSKA